MTTGDIDSTDSDTVPTMECRYCEVPVPAGAFCGLCGAHLTPEPGDGPQWLRFRTFGASPNEGLMRPSITSSLFPHLTRRSRVPFRIGLLLILISLIAFSFVRVPAALITVSALGLPLLFFLYLVEADVFRDVPRHLLAISAVLGGGLGIGWVLLTGEMVARSYGVPMSAGLALHHLLKEGILIPAAGMVLMVLPPVVVRLFRPVRRESLDGFVIGALGAITFAGCATLSRLAPQFATGLIAHNRPIKGLVVEATLHGITVPLTAAVAGGLVGMALWFTGQKDNPHEHPGRTRAALILLAGVVLLIHAGLGVVDIMGVPQTTMLTAHLALTVVALLALRIALQLALLHEAHDPIERDEPLLCVHCEHVVPDMAFCPACGVATRASSRTSRHDRRETRPVRELDAAEGP